jgi:hypothetical protein
VPLVKPFVSLVVKKKKLTTKDTKDVTKGLEGNFLVVKKKKLTTKDTKDVTKGLEGNFSEVLTYPKTRNLVFCHSLPE